MKDRDSILGQASEVKGKRAREALLADADAARLSRDLVTILKDVPVELNLDALCLREGDPARLRALFTELEFHSLMDKIGEETVATEGAGWTVVSSVSEVEDLVAKARRADVLAISAHGPPGDAHVAGLDGLALAVEPGGAWYIPLTHRAPDGDLLNNTAPFNLPPLTDPAMAGLKQLLEDPKVPKAGHNLKRNWLRL